jgi:hypothetical protein
MESEDCWDGIERSEENRSHEAWTVEIYATVLHLRAVISMFTLCLVS